MKYLQTLLQINHYQVRYKECILWVIKIVVMLLCLWFVWDKVANTSFPPGSFLLSNTYLFWLVIVLLLMPVNWWLEVWKWKISLADEALTIKHAAVAVVSGLALNWVLPFTLGDVGGRLANVTNYKQSAIALLVTRIVSLSLTVLFGGYSLLIYFKSEHWFWVILVSVMVVLVLSARLYGLDKIKIYGKIIWLSITRYLVFTFQFFLLIYFYIPDLDFLVVLGGIGWIFLFRSVIPSFFGNFGVREASALVFFEQFMDVPSLVILPCLLIWVINTVIPSLIGALLIFKLRVNIAQ